VLLRGARGGAPAAAAPAAAAGAAQPRPAAGSPAVRPARARPASAAACPALRAPARLFCVPTRSTAELRRQETRYLQPHRISCRRLDYTNAHAPPRCAAHRRPACVRTGHHAAAAQQRLPDGHERHAAPAGQRPPQRVARLRTRANRRAARAGGAASRRCAARRPACAAGQARHAPRLNRHGSPPAACTTSPMRHAPRRPPLSRWMRSVPSARAGTRRAATARRRRSSHWPPPCLLHHMLHLNVSETAPHMQQACTEVQGFQHLLKVCTPPCFITAPAPPPQ
jgi:hypothetical protein